MFFVSVSLRSIIHSYFNILNNLTELEMFFKFPSPYGVSFILISWNGIGTDITEKVSVSLRSIIHSYKNSFKQYNLYNKCYCFRLLTEYHSFLFFGFFGFLLIFSPPVSVSLRSIIHSYSFHLLCYMIIISQFPSPYGVSFILILLAKNSIIWTLEIKVSVSLRSIIHSYAL